MTAEAARQLETIGELAAHVLEAKAAEDKCREWRIAAEEALIGMVGAKAEGAQTTTADGYKVTTTGVMRRTLDAAAWESVKTEIDPVYWPIEVKESLSDTRCKWLAENMPDVWALCSRAVITKPGKTGVKVVKLEE